MTEILDRYLASLRPDIGATHRTRPVAFCEWLQTHSTETDVESLNGDTVTSLLTRPAVERWIKIRERKFRPGTVRLEWLQLRRVFEANGIRWPFAAREIPTVAEGEEDQPLASSELGTALVEASMRLDPIHRALLAVSTTYGIRRAEMTYTWNPAAEEYDGMGNDNFDFDQKLIFVETVKSGRQRYHLIPDAIIPVVQAYDWGEERSNHKVSKVNVDLREEAGLGKDDFARVSWHAIRRRIARWLLDGEKDDAGSIVLPGFTESEADTFMRWKPPSGSMAQRYARGQEVGLDGRRTQQMEERDVTLDRRAFALNPWLGDWERVAGGTT